MKSFMKDNYYYRSGPIQNIKIFNPRIPDKKHESDFIKQVIYVTNDPSFAAGFCFNWSDNDGFKFGRSNNGPWTLNIPEKYIIDLNQKCSMYILKGNAKSFNIKTPEYYFDYPIEVFKEIKFNNCFDCLKTYNVKVNIMK